MLLAVLVLVWVRWGVLIAVVVHGIHLLFPLSSFGLSHSHTTRLPAAPAPEICPALFFSVDRPISQRMSGMADALLLTQSLLRETMADGGDWVTEANTRSQFHDDRIGSKPPLNQFTLKQIKSHSPRRDE